MNISADQWTQALKTILNKAATEQEFRALCLADPAAGVQSATGLIAPPGVRFSETADSSAIQLPPFTSDPTEITDAEVLNNVAGGAGYQLYSLGDSNAKVCNW